MDEEINYGDTAAPADATFDLNDLEKAYAGGQGLDQGIQENYEMLFEYLPLFMSGVLTPTLGKELIKKSPRIAKFLSRFFSNPSSVKNKKVVKKVVDDLTSYNVGSKEWAKQVKRVEKELDIKRAGKELKKKLMNEDKLRSTTPLDVNPRISPDMMGLDKAGKKAGSFPPIGERGYMQDIAGDAFQKRKLTKDQFYDINNWINKNFPKPPTSADAVFRKQPFDYNSQANKGVVDLAERMNQSKGKLARKYYNEFNESKGKLARKYYDEFNEMGQTTPYNGGGRSPSGFLEQAQEIASDPFLPTTIGGIFGVYEGVKYLTNDEQPMDSSGGEWQVPETLPTPYEPGMTSTDSLNQRMMEPQAIDVKPLTPSYDFAPMDMIQGMVKEDKIF